MSRTSLEPVNLSNRDRVNHPLTRIQSVQLSAQSRSHGLVDERRVDAPSTSPWFQYLRCDQPIPPPPDPTETHVRSTSSTLGDRAHSAKHPLSGSCGIIQCLRATIVSLGASDQYQTPQTGLWRLRPGSSRPTQVSNHRILEVALDLGWPGSL